MKSSTRHRAAIVVTQVLLAALAACHSGPKTAPVQVTSLDTGNGTRHFEATTGGRADDRFTWDFGDGSTATGASVDHAYARAGQYTVMARAPDGGGATEEEDISFADRVQGHACVPGSSWCWQAESVLPGIGRPAYFLDAQHGWTYSELGAGAVAATTDGGLTWTAQTVPSVHQLVAFRFADALHGVVTSSANELMATDDGGATWRLVSTTLPLTHQGAAARPVSVTPDRIVLDGGQASADGGRTWTALPLSGVTDVPGDADCWNWNDTRVMRLAGCAGTVAADVTPPGWRTNVWPVLRAFSSPQRVLVLEPGVPTLGWESLDAGATWQAFTPQGLGGATPGSLLMTSATAGWLLTQEGTLFVTQDAGRDWIALALPATFQPGGRVSSIGRLPDGALWVSDGTRVARLADGGLSWDVLALPVPDTLLWNLSAWSADGSVAAVVDGSSGWRLADGTWQRLFGANPAGVFSGTVAFVARDARHALAVGSDGVQWRTVDGVHWTPSSPFAPGLTSPVALQFPTSGTPGITGWLVQGGRLWTTADDGGTWQSATTPGPLTSLLDVHFTDVAHGWLLDRQTGLYRTTDVGAHWTAVAAPSPGPWTAMAFVSDRRGMLVRADGATWLTGDGGVTWQAAEARPDVSRLKITGDGSIWSFGYQFQRSRDGGVTFTPLASQVSPPRDIVFTDSLHGWLVDQSGAVSVTVDGGNTWTPIQLGDWTLNLQAIAMADPSTGWIITGTGDLLFTATGGR